MSEEVAPRGEVGAAAEQVGRERVAEPVRGPVLRSDPASLNDGFPSCILIAMGEAIAKTRATPGTARLFDAIRLSPVGTTASP